MRQIDAAEAAGIPTDDGNGTTEPLSNRCFGGPV